MRLLDLIVYFRDGGTFEEFCGRENLDASAEIIEIYAEEPANIDSTLAFFPIEETEGRIDFEKNGVKYLNLFDFLYFMDAMNEAKNLKKTSNPDLAEKLFRYAIKDA